ncbi:MAG: carbohydrate ABC transporter permease [Chloroflexi bacterium]|nr:carbohydrate ABC transporter permease [Chloroflexota bacterium]
MTHQVLPTSRPALVADRTSRGRRQPLGGYRALKSLSKVLTYTVLTALSAISVFPLLFTLSNALKSNDQMYVMPPVWIPNPLMIEHTVTAWNALPFTLYTFNTLVITILSMAGHLLSGSLVAFGFSRLRGPGRDKLFALLLATMMLPGQVTIIPDYIMMKYLGWLDTFLPLIVPSFFGGGAFFIFLLRQFMLGISTELDDAARIDGCSSWRIYWSIVLPLIKPALGAVAIFAFVGNWNDFFYPLIFLNQQSKFTIALGLRLYQLQVFHTSFRTHSVQGLLGLSLVVLLPVVIVFFFAQKQFIQGITFTGLKG